MAKKNLFVTPKTAPSDLSKLKKLVQKKERYEGEYDRLTFPIPKPLKLEFKSILSAKGLKMTDVLLQHVSNYVKKHKEQN
jgi:hypothetical protein